MMAPGTTPPKADPSLLPLLALGLALLAGFVSGMPVL